MPLILAVILVFVAAEKCSFIPPFAARSVYPISAESPFITSFHYILSGRPSTLCLDYCWSTYRWTPSPEFSFSVLRLLFRFWIWLWNPCGKSIGMNKWSEKWESSNVWSGAIILHFLSFSDCSDLLVRMITVFSYSDSWYFYGRYSNSHTFFSLRCSSPTLLPLCSGTICRHVNCTSQNRWDQLVEIQCSWCIISTHTTCNRWSLTIRCILSVVVVFLKWNNRHWIDYERQPNDPINFLPFHPAHWIVCIFSDELHRHVHIWTASHPATHLERHLHCGWVSMRVAW